jgi:hypothetical protein
MQVVALTMFNYAFLAYAVMMVSPLDSSHMRLMTDEADIRTP